MNTYLVYENGMFFLYFKNKPKLKRLPADMYGSKPHIWTSKTEYRQRICSDFVLFLTGELFGDERCIAINNFKNILLNLTDKQKWMFFPAQNYVEFYAGILTYNNLLTFINHINGKSRQFLRRALSTNQK